MREFEPLSAQQVAFRKETAIEMLELWRNDRPVSKLRSDLKDAKIGHYEETLRLIATIELLSPKAES